MRASRLNWQRRVPEWALTAANSPAGTGVTPFALDRRRFVQGGLGAVGLAVAAPLLAACGDGDGDDGDDGDRGDDVPAADPLPADAPAATDERIVIVGAGAAALAVADELEVRGFHNVVLLEARDRVGGRIWTSSIGDGIPVELGATWIHGVRGNPVSDIVESNGIATAETDYDNAVLYDHDGRRAEPVDPVLWGAYMALAYETPEASLADVFERFAATHGLSGDDRRLWLHWLASMFSHEFGADISDLSIMSYDGPSTMRGGDVVFPQGYSQITDALAAGRDIRLNHPVTGIDHSAFHRHGHHRVGSHLRGRPGGGHRSPRRAQGGRNLVHPGSCRRPCGTPSPLWTWGSSTGRSCCSTSAFWYRDTEWIGYAGQLPGRWSETLNLYPYLGQPVLAMFNPGSFGAQIEQYSDAELTSRAVEALTAMFGDVPEPVDAVSTRWGSDPWTKGSYSYLPVGVDFENYREMSRPVGERLFFAGEATHSRFPSTVHGALLSGRRAARQIYGLLR